MSYTFANLTDEKLDELLSAALDEKRIRMDDRIKDKKYPHPDKKIRDRIECIKAYRTEHNVTLFEAQRVVDHYWNELHGEAA